MVGTLAKSAAMTMTRLPERKKAGPETSPASNHIILAAEVLSADVIWALSIGTAATIAIELYDKPLIDPTAGAEAILAIAAVSGLIG